MPQAVLAAAVSTGVAFATNTILAKAIVSTFFKSLVINFFAQTISKALSNNEQGFTAEASGRSVMFRSPVAPHQVIYGESVVSGPLVFGAITGADNRYLHLVIPVAGHQVEAIDEVLINDKPVSDYDQFNINHEVRLDTRGGSTLTVTLDGHVFSNNSPFNLSNDIAAHPDYTSKIQGYQHGKQDDGITGTYIFVIAATAGVNIVTEAGAGIREVKVITQGDLAVRINTHLGDPNQLADADLVAEVPEWTSNHRGRGRAYIYARFRWNTKAWPSGVSNIKARIRGKNDIYDPRGPSTGYSNNWALCAADYLQWQNGFNSDAAEVEQTKVISAANICDEQVEYQPGLFQYRYEVNGAFKLDRSPIAVLTDLRSAGAGAAVFQMGQWHIYAGAAMAADPRTLTENDLRGPIKFQTKASRQNLFNAVRGTFVNKDERYQQTDFPPVTNATYETEDGGERIYQDIALPFTDEVYASQRLGKIELENHRQPILVEFPAKIIGLKYAIWDVVPLTIAALGWSGKLFRVMDWQLAGPGGPDLILKEYAATAWDWSFGEATVVDPAPNTSLPSPGVVNAPTSLVLASGTDYLLQGTDGGISSNISADWFGSELLFFDHYEVQHKLSSSIIWEESGTTTQQNMTIGPVQDAVDYDVRVRSVNRLNQSSDWTEVLNHTVIGKSAPPSDVTGFRVLQNGSAVIFRWNKPTDIDRDGFTIRYGPRGNTNWDDATPLTEVTQGTNVTSEDVAPGDWTFFIKQIDQSKIESVNAASDDLLVTTQLNDITTQLNAPGWPGILTNFHVHHTGKLIPNSTSINAIIGWRTFDEFVPDPVATATYEGPEIDIDFDDQVRAFGEIESALGSGETGVANPAFELDHRLEGGSYAGFKPWSIGSVEMRYAKGKLTLDTSQGVAYITEMKVVVDQLEHEFNIQGLTIDPGGTVITFPTRYHNKPSVSCNIESATALLATPDEVTETDFKFHVFDPATGISVGGSGAGYISKGN